MICVVDASVAIKWFVDGDLAAREDNVESALDLLRASRNGLVDFYQPPHFLAEVAAVLARLTPGTAQQCAQDIAAMNITWAAPTVAYSRAIALACELNHHLFDTLYHAVAMETPGAVFVTADRRYFDKARHLGQIGYLPDFGQV
jgi:predicted nucleic acid-binding protein